MEKGKQAQEAGQSKPPVDSFLEREEKDKRNKVFPFGGKEHDIWTQIAIFVLLFVIRMD